MRLSVQIEFDKTMDLETPKLAVEVGRSPQSDIVIPHESISRHHCLIESDNDLFHITDLDSSNGTFINGHKLKPNMRTIFKPGSQLNLGKLECELVNSSLPVANPETIISSEVSSKGNYTATMRISRIELNRPSITLELEKKVKPKGPMNPICEHSKKSVQLPEKSNKPYIILFVVVSVILAWLLGAKS